MLFCWLASYSVIIMERIIHCQIGFALSSNCQHGGFCPHCSTISLLLSVIHNWALCLEHRSTVHNIFLDYAKAFDLVPHECLFIKLDVIGITGLLLKWLRGFLTNRLQQVEINGCYSEWIYDTASCRYTKETIGAQGMNSGVPLSKLARVKCFC